MEWWQYKGRHSITKIPHIDLATFPKELRSWWISIQPSVRRGTSLLRTTNARNAEWSALQHGGLDGMFAVVMCLSWYMVSLPPPIDQRPLLELIDDVTWVFGCLNTPDKTAEILGVSSGSRRQSRASVKRSAPEPPAQKPSTKKPSKRARR